MKPARLLRNLLIAVAALAVLGQVIGWAAHGRIEAALGEGASLGSARVGLSGVIVVRDLRLGTPAGWPAADTLVLGRAVVRPAWTTLLSPQIRIRSVELDEAYVALRRTRQGVQVVPTLLQPAPKPAPEQEPAGEPWQGSVQIERIALTDSTVELYDESASRPVTLRLESLQVQIEDLLLPALSSRTQLQLSARIKGNAHDGELAISGWTQWDRRESSLKTGIKGLDLTSVQPYLESGAPLGLQRGLFDLDVQAETRNNRLNAQGLATLRGLAFASGPGIKGSFLGVPTIALVKVMESGRGQIPLKFRLDGDLDDPKFSLNEALPLRLAVGLAETLGLSVKGVISGVGNLGGKGVEAVGDAAKGVGSAVGKLFGGGNKD